MELNRNAIVIDVGSASVKAGIAGDEAPLSVFPSIIGRPNHNTALHLNGAERQDFYIGSEAQSKREILSISHPVKNRLVTNWDDMILLMDYTFKKKLHLSPEMYSVLSTDTFSNPKADREKMTEIMFERFKVPSYYVANEEMLSLYANGHTDGLVINSGEGGTSIVAIYEGFVLPGTNLELEIGGQKLTEFLGFLLAERRLLFSTSIVQDIKKQLCYIAPSLEEALNTASESTYMLPDGQRISVGNQKCRVPEAYFNPTLIGMETSGLHRKCHESILKCDIDIRSHMYSNILLSGGSTLFSGFRERVENELRKLAPSSTTIKVIAPSYRAHSVWSGGSIVASLTNFPQMCISKKEYQESGSSIVHRKCF